MLFRSICLHSNPIVLPTYRLSSSHAISSAVFNTFEFPASCIESLLLSTHDSLHLPWWSVLVVTTLTLRAITTLPIQIYTQRKTAKVEIAYSELAQFHKPLSFKIMAQCKRDNLTVEEANKKLKLAYNKIRHDVLTKHAINIHIYRLQSFILPVFQLPLFISMSIAIRNLTGALPGWYKSTFPVASMKLGGIGWFQDLTVPEPYFVFPLIIMVANLINISIYSNQIRKRTLALEIVNNTFRFLSIGLAYAATQMPAAISLYWMLSSCYGLGQNIVLKFPKFRRAFRIPKTESESEHPIRLLMLKYRSNWSEFIKKQKQHQDSR